MSFDLNDADASWLAQAPGLDEIMEAVKNAKVWRHTMTEALDFAYRCRFARMLMNHPSSEEMEELAEHLYGVIDHLGGNCVGFWDTDHLVRWDMLRDILEDRLAVRDEAIPEMVIKRRYVREILEKIRANGSVSHNFLIDKLGIEPGKLPRIIALMVGWELVIEDRTKKEKCLSLGPRAGEVLPYSIRGNGGD